MALKLITPPSALAYELADAKKHLGVTHDNENELITSYIAASIANLDGRDGCLGMCLITQVWELKLDAFSAQISLPLPPCRTVDSITYVDGEGEIRTLSTSDYRVYGLNTNGAAKIQPAYGLHWPNTRAVPEAVTIRFTAGFGAASSSIPDPIRQNIAERVAHLYEPAEGVIGAEDIPRNYRQFEF